MKISPFNNRHDPDVYPEVEKNVKFVFDCHKYSEEKKVKLVVEFHDYTITWCDKMNCERMNSREIKTN